MLEQILYYFPEDEVLKADGFDEAVIGISEDFNQPLRLVYSMEKCIQILMKDMSREDAIEYFHFNMKGAYMGDKTPIWCIDCFE